MRVVQTDLWLCGDCTMFAVNGEPPHDEQAEHACMAGFERLGTYLSANWDSETDEGYNDHSIDACDCCRSRLHGERWRFAVLGE